MLKFSVLMLAACITAWSAKSIGYDQVRLPEIDFRSRAIKNDIPYDTYLNPRVSPGPRGLWVIVSEVSLNVDGTVKSVSVVETPSIEIAMVIKRIISEWRFEPSAEGISYYSLITLYGRDSGHGMLEVVSPDDVIANKEGGF